jgi:hypothetical protein
VVVLRFSSILRLLTSDEKYAVKFNLQHVSHTGHSGSYMDLGLYIGFRLSKVKCPGLGPVTK